MTRAAVLSVIAVALAAGAHATAGGATPGVPVLVLLALVLTVPVLVLAGRRRGVLLTAALLGAGQWVMHQAFVLLTAPACTTAAAGTAGPGGLAAGHLGHAGHAGHLAGGGSGALAAVCAGGAHAHDHVGHPDSLTMVALHVVATVLTASVLASGERALAWLGAWLSGIVRLPSVTTSFPRPEARCAPSGRPIVLPGLLLGWRCTPLRGPPVAA